MPASRPRVLLTDPIAPDGHRVLATAAEIVQAPDGEPGTVRSLARDVDGILIRSKLPDDIFSVAQKLRAVVIHGTGTDLVSLEDANRRGIMVANLPGANAQSVAEYCAMAMLTLARNTLAITNAMRAQPWDAARALGAGAHEIGAMTLGIVGVGAIGQWLARVAGRGFGMRVLGTQRRLDRMGPDAQPASLEDLLRQSDFVVITCPLTPQTRHLMNRDRFALMKPSAWLVNVGRGAVVQEEALIAALRERRIAGAMLDVYEHYRITPGHPLFALDNVVLTPHLAGMTVESRARMAAAAAEEMLRMLRGERPLNLVNPDSLRARPAHH
jgi:D-3-phosphoglycerate dehydrogenase